MGKSRSNNKSKMVNFETLCLDCGTIGFTVATNIDKKYYSVFETECPICKKTTKHIKCRNLDTLKAELEFEDKDFGINQIILDVMNSKNKEKQL